MVLVSSGTRKIIESGALNDTHHRLDIRLILQYFPGLLTDFD
jgi:hypothetical protein